MADLISVKDCPCDGCKAKPCGHPARCVTFTLWLNKTVDAVKVVRFRDCKYFELNLFDGCEVCTHISGYVRPDFGCVDGERKNDD